MVGGSQETGCCKYGNETSGFKRGVIFYDMGDYQLLKLYSYTELHLSYMTRVEQVLCLLQPCPGESSCVASKSRIQRVSTLRGMQELSVVEECDCRHKSKRCYRQPHTLQLYPGTPYETHLDVGTCSGPCDSGEQTQRSRTCWTGT
jgi:hypothetical protein